MSTNNGGEVPKFETGLVQPERQGLEGTESDALEGKEGLEIPIPNLQAVEGAVDAAFAGRGEAIEPVDGASVEVESKEAEIRAKMEALEQAYLEKRKPDLRERYEDEATGAEHVQGQLNEFASRVEMDCQGAEFAGQKFERVQAEVIKTAVLEQATKYFESEKGTKNPEKHKIAQEVLKKMVDYAAQAMEDGDLSSEVTAQDVYQMVMISLTSMLYQDRAATENLLGDHGIRHVWKHNVGMCEQIDSELKKNGQDVPAIDSLLKILAMTDHDLGYAMDPVRKSVNTGGFGADAGHGLLAAKYTRERGDLSKIFSPEQLALLHEMILTHDYAPDSALEMHDSSPEARAKNMREIIRIADNTHAFEDKLPELLYAHPKTLTYLKLIEIAVSSGASEQTVEDLKQELKREIADSDKFSEDDKEALSNAISTISSTTAKFSVGRICGNRPKVSVDSSGRTTIEVNESEIHQMVVGTFGQESLAQLRKLIKDLTGKSEIDFDVDEIADDKGVIAIRVRTNSQQTPGESTKTDYQEAVERVITDEDFQDFLADDGFLSGQIKDLQTQLDKATDPQEQKQLSLQISNKKLQRLNNLMNKYIQNDRSNPMDTVVGQMDRSIDSNEETKTTPLQSANNKLQSLKADNQKTSANPMDNVIENM